VPQTLLLADDSVTIQRVIELTFADEDIDVVAVSDGDQAIARLDAMPPDIVLADVGMPGKSGYEVAAYVKQTPRLAHIPVVLLTGAFEPVDEAKAAAAGCDGVLAKPFEPQLVIGRVRELLSRPRPAGLLDAVAAPPPPAPATHAWPASADEAPIAFTPAAASKKIDDYFDQLDAAFTSLSVKPQATGAPAVSPAPVEVDWFGLKPAARPAEMPDVSIAREAPHQPFWTEPVDLPIVPPAPMLTPAPEAPQASPPQAMQGPQGPQEVELQGPLESLGLQTPAPVQTPAPMLTPPPAPEPVRAAALPAPPVQPAAAPSLPPLADAFAALLAAEQGESPLAPPPWPSPVVAPAVTDDLVEQVSRRVLEQLTDSVVRAAVPDIVSAIAERLVREEIERIKASIA
jgi:CheY-like chemotaxis protein